MNFVIDQAYAWLLCFILAGLVAQWRRPAARSRALVAISVGFAALVGMSLPAVGFVALGTLEWRYPPRHARPDGVGAIVVLGGSVLPADEIRAKPELGRSSYARCRFALDVYRAGPPVPIVLCGGSPDERKFPAVAPLMRDLLVEQGVPSGQIQVDDRSRTTDENASEGASRLKSLGVSRAVLITEAMHMNRAAGVFQTEGIDVIPWACNHRATSLNWSLGDQLPNPKSAGVCVEVLHEWAGSVWYAAKGRIAWNHLFSFGA